MLTLIICALISGGICCFFYIKAIKEIRSISRSLYEAHVSNSFSEVAKRQGQILLDQICELEKERIAAFVKWNSLKGKRNLTITERNDRDSSKRTYIELSRCIDSLVTSITETYTPEVTDFFVRANHNKFLKVLKRYIDRL